jgi:hypothetical protein
MVSNAKVTEQPAATSGSGKTNTHQSAAPSPPPSRIKITSWKVTVGPPADDKKPDDKKDGDAETAGGQDEKAPKADPQSDDQTVGDQTAGDKTAGDKTADKPLSDRPLPSLVRGQRLILTPVPQGDPGVPPGPPVSIKPVADFQFSSGKAQAGTLTLRVEPAGGSGARASSKPGDAWLVISGLVAGRERTLIEPIRCEWKDDLRSLVVTLTRTRWDARESRFQLWKDKTLENQPIAVGIKECGTATEKEGPVPEPSELIFHVLQDWQEALGGKASRSTWSRGSVKEASGSWVGKLKKGKLLSDIRGDMVDTTIDGMRKEFGAAADAEAAKTKPREPREELKNDAANPEGKIWNDWLQSKKQIQERLETEERKKLESTLGAARELQKVSSSKNGKLSKADWPLEVLASLDGIVLAKARRGEIEALLEAADLSKAFEIEWLPQAAAGGAEPPSGGSK